MKNELNWLETACTPPNHAAKQLAAEHQNQLTKPRGSLGLLEDIALDFASWQGKPKPVINRIAIRVFAADHGICQHNISAYPQEVTAQMILNFINRGAAVSVLASTFDADFKVINLGTSCPVPDLPNLIKDESYVDATIAPGTQDFSIAPAMSQAQLVSAIQAGAEQICKVDLFIGGEMGIGNTTSAAAIYAAILQLKPEQAVGPGTGVDTETQKRKAQLISKALDKHSLSMTSPAETLRMLGGFEVAALVGAYIKAAQLGIPSLIDGFICTAAALIATQINPSVAKWFFYGHQSAEPAHQIALSRLGATPILNLNMRLGEGSGAAVAVPLIQSALNLHNNMATFADAGVSDLEVSDLEVSDLEVSGLEVSELDH